MKKIFFLILAFWSAGLLAAFPLASNDKNTFYAVDSPEIPHDDTVFVGRVEINAQFPGGDDAFNQWLGENIEYPKSAIRKNKQGRVIVDFTVDVNGNIGNVAVQSGVKGAPELGTEAVRVIRLSPKWKPASLNGRIVPTYRMVPIDFVLPN